MNQAPAQRKGSTTPHASTLSDKASKKPALATSATTPHARVSNRLRSTTAPVAPAPTPTAPVREVPPAEAEFMQAMQAYKVSSGRMFPTWSEVLEVLKALGYEKPASTVTFTPAAEPAATPHARTA